MHLVLLLIIGYNLTANIFIICKTVRTVKECENGTNDACWPEEAFRQSFGISDLVKIKPGRRAELCPGKESMYTYCLFCETNKTEFIAKTISEMTGCRALCPKQIQHTWAKGGGTRDIVNDLMPGYVFLYFTDKADVSLLNSMQHVIKCLSSTAGEYEMSGQDEQFALMLLEKNGVIGKTPVYREGQMIRMAGGAFEGVTAKILKVERRLSRMQIEIPFARQLVKTWVEYEIVEPETT